MASMASMASLEPLYDGHKRFELSARVLQGDETPVALLELDQTMRTAVSKTDSIQCACARVRRSSSAGPTT